MPASRRRRALLASIWACVLAAASALPVASQDRAQPARSRPNIVILLTDDQCFDSLGCYGNTAVVTPAIDRLAADGLCFDRHYVTTAICMASRASIMTGRHEFRHGCNFEHGPLPIEHWRRSYPMRLRAAGYRTAIAGKIGFVVAERVGEAGGLPRADFDAWGAGPDQTFYETARNPAIAHYADRYPHSTRAYGAFGRDFIAQAARDGVPFCLSISFKAPHRPATPDPRYDGDYVDATFPKRANFGREHGAHFAEQSRRGRQYERFVSWGYADRYDEVMAVYHRQIRGIDDAVAMVRSALQENGVAGDTVILFTSDNGFLCGAHGYGSKVLPYEEASRVPLIVHDPRSSAPGGRRCAALTGNVDIAATVIALAGLDREPGMDGRDLMPLYEDPAAVELGHDWLPLINVWGPPAVHSLAVVTRDAKYVYWPEHRDAARDERLPAAEELYDLAADRLELQNLAADPAAADRTTPTAALLQDMRRRYDALVETWRRDGVPYHDYAPHALRFARARRRGD